jgi:hypothetical protein
MSEIHFTATPFKIGSWTILKLPKPASAKLPSRALVMVEGTMNGLRFQAPLEPDGEGSHWFRLNKTMREAAGNATSVVIEPIQSWPEPKVPADLKKALAATPQAQKTWIDTTTLARWEWIRWVRSTRNPETRKKRIEMTCSKLTAGEKRPCCFDRSQCTEPAVSKGGVLLGPTEEGE